MLVSGSSIFVGNSAITAVYQGDDLIWPIVEPPTPSSGDCFWFLDDPHSSWITPQYMANYFSQGKGVKAGHSSNMYHFNFHLGNEYKSGCAIYFALPSGMVFSTIRANKILPNTGQEINITSYFLQNTPVDFIRDGVSYKLYYTDDFFLERNHFWKIRIYI